MCVLGLAGSRKPKSKKVNVRRMLTLHAPWLHREWTGRTTDLDSGEQKFQKSGIYSLHVKKSLHVSLQVYTAESCLVKNGEAGPLRLVLWLCNTIL